MRPPTEAVTSLAWIVAAVAFVIFVGVEAALLYAAWRYRASRSSGPVPQRYGHRGLEIAWTVAPIIVLAVVAVFMFQTMFEIGVSTPRAGTPSMRIVATGYQWWWEYRYPTAAGDVVVANELHIPVGTAIDLELRSGDVIHSWWVPRLNGKTDMIPGKANHLLLYTNDAGTYEGQCAEFCGVEHAWMRIRVVAEPRGDFDHWLAGQAADAGAAAGTSDGERVFMSSVCVSCHTIRGTAAAGRAGPDLTHVGSRGRIATGVLENTPANMRAWLADTQRVKPGVFMPKVPLADGDLDALVAYLEGLK